MNQQGEMSRKGEKDRNFWYEELRDTHGGGTDMDVTSVIFLCMSVWPREERKEFSVNSWPGLTSFREGESGSQTERQTLERKKKEHLSYFS